MVRLAHIDYLYLLGFIPVLIFLLVTFMLWRKKALNRFGEFRIIQPLIPEYSNRKIIFKFILLMIAWIVLVFALADPQTGSKLEKIQRKGIDVFIALDVSNSMLAEDIKPNRLERSKQAISRLIDKLDGDRIGIIVFAGKAYMQLPITTDYSAAKLFLSSITTGMMPTQGTAIGEAIKMAVGSYGETKNNKALVIITDGEDHEGDVLEQADIGSQNAIAIYTIGMGLPEGAPIPVYSGTVLSGYKKDPQGNTIISKLDEAMLERIATVGKGIYVRANNSDAGLQRVFEDMGKIEKSEIETRQFSDYEDQFQYLVAFAMFLLILDLFVFDKKTRWLKRITPFN